MRKTLSSRGQLILQFLIENPDKTYSFADLAEKFGSCPTGIVSIMRSISRAGYGDFRDQVRGERFLYDRVEVKKRAELRKERGIFFPGGGPRH